MGYLTGNGSQADPYIIYDEQSWELFISYGKYGSSAGCRSSSYFRVIADINCGGKAYDMGGNSGVFNAKLFGVGHKIFNFRLTPSGGVVCTILNGSIDNIDLDFFIESGWYLSDSVTCVITRSRFSVNTGFLFGYAKHLNTSSNSVFVNKSGGGLFKYGGTTSAPNSVYVITDAAISIVGANVVNLINAYLPASYPNLTADIWILDGVTFPRLYVNGNPLSDTQKFVVKGITKIGGIGKKRDVAILSPAYLGVLKKITSEIDGSFFINLWQISDPVYVMHYDDYGFPLAVNAGYALGSYIHQKTPNGYRYKCTTAGSSGVELPAEPWPTSSNLITGTAIFTPEPVYKTETFLVSPHLYDFLTGQPV